MRKSLIFSLTIRNLEASSVRLNETGSDLCLKESGAVNYDVKKKTAKLRSLSEIQFDPFIQVFRPGGAVFLSLFDAFRQQIFNLSV